MKKLKVVPDFVLKREEGQNCAAIEFRFHGETDLGEMLDNFKHFLLACGYAVPQDEDLHFDETVYVLTDKGKAEIAARSPL